MASLHNQLLENLSNSINKLNDRQTERILDNIEIDQRFIFTLLNFDLKFIRNMTDERKCVIIAEMKKILKSDELSKIILYDDSISNVNTET